VFKSPFNRRFMLIGSSGSSAHGFAKKKRDVGQYNPRINHHPTGVWNTAQIMSLFRPEMGGLTCKKTVFCSDTLRFNQQKLGKKHTHFSVASNICKFNRK